MNAWAGFGLVMGGLLAVVAGAALLAAEMCREVFGDR